MLNKVLQGDCLEVMKTFKDECIDLTVTSPPYDNLRTYNGYTFDFEGIAKELYRVTKQGGVVVWVVKDAVVKGNRTLTSFKQAIKFQELGFNVFDTIIWSKPNSSLPHKGRYFDTFEYMFILSKGLPKSVNLLKDRKNKYAGTSNFGNRSVREIDGTLTNKGKKIIADYSYRFNIWEYSVGFNKSSSDRNTFKHPATFPEKLAEDHILSWSNEGDTVFDPMAGSGTTIKMAKKNNRNYIGIEISQEYIDIINARLGKNDTTQFEKIKTI